jgi:hypothetical protein
MAIVCGFRFDVGRDYNNYLNAFYYLTHGVYYKAEFLYKYLLLFINQIGGTQQLVFLIMSCLTCFFYYKFIEEQSDNFYLSTVIYLCIGPYYFSSYNTIREALAVGISLYSLRFILKSHNTKMFFLCILTGMLVHKSMLFVLVIWLVHKVLRKNPLAGCVVGTVAGVAVCYSGLINRALGLFNGAYDRYMGIYQQSMDFSYIFFLIVAVIILLMSQLKYVEIDDFYLSMDAMCIILISIPLLTGSYSMMLTRLASFVTPVFIIIIPEIINGFVQKSFVKYAIVFVCIGYYLILVTTNADLSPYHMNFALFG